MLKTKDFEKKEKYPNYQPSKDDVVKIDYIRNRFEQMRSARTQVDKDWDIYQQMIEAIYTPYPDERSSSVVPLASAMIELFVADTLKLQTDFSFRAETSEHSTQAKALEYVWKYDWRKNNRKKAFIENEYITAGFGTSVIYTGFESYNRTQKDFIVGDDMKLTWEEVSFLDEKIIVKNVDIRDFYIDDQAKNSIEEATDCIYRQWISFDKFKQYTNNPYYNNVDKVTPKGYSNEYHSFITQEEKVKQGDFVELMHYWNVEKDAYMVLANGVLVREHPMISTIDGKKALPFTIRKLGYKNYSIYGRGMCEALMMFNSEVNNLRELLMDGIRRSNTQVLAIGSGVSFDGRQFSYDNEVLTFNGNLSENFQQISGNPPNQAIFSYITQIYKDIAIYVGLDIQNIVGQPHQTAFQTDVQREASQKRINVWLMNRDLAFERFANLYKDLLQVFFPRKTADGLYPKIEIEGEKLIGKGEKTNFRKYKGKSIFEVTPDILRGDLYIDVYTNVNAPTINAVDRQQKMELLQSLGGIAQGYAMAKQSGIDVETILPIKQTLRDLASDYNLEVQQGSDSEGNKEEIDKLRAELKGMIKPAGGEGQPEGQPQPQGQPQGQPQEIPPNPMQQGAM